VSKKRRRLTEAAPAGKKSLAEVSWRYRPAPSRTQTDFPAMTYMEDQTAAAARRETSARSSFSFSATRKASSNACSPFSLGSQCVW
jgi:hypothetical protein